MKKVKIDILSNTELNKSFDIEPSFPKLIGSQLIVGQNSIDWNERGKKRNEFSIACYNLKNSELVWETLFKSEQSNCLKCEVIEIDGNLIACSSNKLFSINSTSGEINWTRKFSKHSSPKLSIIGGKVFWSNWGELQEIDPNNGKKIKSLKPRIKWFDSVIIENDLRYFVSTSNSKILELDIQELSVKTEFKFKGGWAVACEPHFFKNLMISNSYGSKTNVYNLNDNSQLKSFNRKTGAKPVQAGFEEFFLSYHGNSDNKLNCFDIYNLKKKWSKEIERIQFMQIDDGKVEFFFKENERFKIGELTIKEPTSVKIINESEYQNWSNYPFDLWEGVSIIKNEIFKVYNYEPNKILCITSDDDDHSSTLFS